MRHRRVAIGIFVALAACGAPTTPDAFRADDFFGEWRLELAATPCWEPLSIAFAIDRASVEFEGQGRMQFSSRWGTPSEPERTRLVSGWVGWNAPGLRSVHLVLFRSGVVLGEVSQVGGELRTDRFEGDFFDPNRPACSTHVVVQKVGS